MNFLKKVFSTFKVSNEVILICIENIILQKYQVSRYSCDVKWERKFYLWLNCFTIDVIAKSGSNLKLFTNDDC